MKYIGKIAETESLLSTCCTCFKGIILSLFLRFSAGCWNCSESVVFVATRKQLHLLSNFTNIVNGNHINR